MILAGHWDNKKYNTFIDELIEERDNKYKDFIGGLGTNNVIGVRLPILKKYAKEIAHNDYISFIKSNTHKTREEILIHGLILGYLKIPFKDLIPLIYDYLIYNNSWETNDITVLNMKIFKRSGEDGYQYALKLLASNKPFTIRFGLIIILGYYVDEEHIDNILERISVLKEDDYYAKMALAWLVSVSYIKMPHKTYKWLKMNYLDKFTNNKSISKICDSYRVSEEDKERVKELRSK